MIKAVENDNDDATEFLTQEFHEITPEEFHGMPMSERTQGDY